MPDERIEADARAEAGADPVSEAPVGPSDPTAGPASTPGRELDEAEPGKRATGLYFYGVVRTRGWRSRSERDEVVPIRYRDLEALVRPGPFELPRLDATHLQAHQRTVESTMRRGTILPAPFGVVFRGRRAVVRFLEDQYLALDEGLAFLEGHWELRIHATARGAEQPDAELEDVATRVYAELRRMARAAIPFPRDEHSLISAAFLVDRRGWIDFVNRADDLVGSHPGLAFDITGPWPPYDFVRMSA